MVKISIVLFFILLFICGCINRVPKSLSSESATKWYSECYPPYPRFHPGDVIKVADDFIHTFEERGCATECMKKNVCREGRGYFSCVRNIDSCIKSCEEEIAKAHSVAYHIEGGYYSDGSYYAGCSINYFNNLHPTADKYKKTKWQTDRDDCMKLTSEGKNNYKSCLKERGY